MVSLELNSVSHKYKHGGGETGLSEVVSLPLTFPVKTKRKGVMSVTNHENDYDRGFSADPDYWPSTRGNTRERMSDYDEAYRERPYGGRAEPPESASFDYGRGGSRYGSRREVGYIGGGESRYATRATPEDWQRPGPHTGRGPRNYRRSSKRIEEDVNERLTQHGWLDATNLQVEVEEDVVTLRGEVDAYRDKRLAEDIAYSVSGVHDINNRIAVRRQEQTERG